METTAEAPFPEVDPGAPLSELGSSHLLALTGDGVLAASLEADADGAGFRVRFHVARLPLPKVGSVTLPPFATATSLALPIGLSL